MKYTKNSFFSSWNHRVVEYPRRRGERLLIIHEAHYFNGRKKVPSAITETGTAVSGRSKKELRATLERMLKSLDAPVLKYRKYVPK